MPVPELIIKATLTHLRTCSMNLLRRSTPLSTFFWDKQQRQQRSPDPEWGTCRDVPIPRRFSPLRSLYVTVGFAICCCAILCYKWVLISSLDWMLSIFFLELCQQLIGNDVLFSNEILVCWNMVSTNYSTLNKCSLCRALSFFSKPSPKVRRSNRRTTMFSPSLGGLWRL